MIRATTRPFLCLSLALASATQTSSAQRSLGPEKHDLNNLRGDIWSVWRAPAGTRPRDLLAVAGTLGAAALTSRMDSAAYAWMQSHEQTFVMRLLAPIRESAGLPLYELGSGQLLLPFAGAMYLTGRVGKSANLRDAGIGCAAGHLASLGLRQVVFRTVRRGRPQVTADPYDISFPGSSEWSWQSFYSGHISNSMACASFLTHRFALGAAEPVPYAFSLAIGVGRLADGHHWASDFVVGSVVGFAVGRAIAQRQLNRRDESRAPGSGLVVRIPVQIPVAQWSVAF